MSRTHVSPARALARGLGLFVAVSAVSAFAQTGAQIDVNAASQAASQTRTHIVVTRDLDLADARGQRVLDRRLKVAAALVCDARDAFASRHYEGLTGCYGRALEDGRAQAAQRRASADAAPIRVRAG